MVDQIKCWALGPKCHGCPHYHGKADLCEHRPATAIGRFWWRKKDALLSRLEAQEQTP